MTETNLNQKVCISGHFYLCWIILYLTHLEDLIALSALISDEFRYRSDAKLVQQLALGASQANDLYILATVPLGRWPL